jgi:uncharacterized membrane protein YphA (DoxX/SURF4 family)
VHAVLERFALPPSVEPWLAFAASVLDLVLGAWLLLGWRTRAAAWLALVSVAAYTFVLGVFAPTLWLDLAGGLAKNLALIPALLVLLALSERR